MQCTICDRPAELIEPAMADAKSVRCSSCGAYEMSGVAEAVLSQKDAFARLSALRFAQTNAPAGRRPYIHGLT